MKVGILPQEHADTAARAVAIGVFDGVHLGHREVLCRVMDVEDAVPTVLTFVQSPRHLPKQADALLTEQEKRELLESLGIEEIWEMEFPQVRELSPEQFVRRILHEELHAVTVCCGEDFRFGRDGSGDVTQLTALCAAYDIRVIAVPVLQEEGTPISSSAIRAAIAAGDLYSANRLLGKPFALTAVVEHGKARGREWGFPTLNQRWCADKIVPRYGVYLSCVEVEGTVHTAVTDIGVRPTVDGGAPTAETYILDWDGDLYGQAVTVRPLLFLREERRFPSEAALCEQVRKDIETARAAIAPTGCVRAVLLDFDDTLQDRPKAFHAYTDYFVRRHFPMLTAAQQAERSQEMWEQNACGHGYAMANHYIPYETYFEYFIDKWQWEDPPAMPQLLKECNLRFAACATLFDGAEETLAALRAAGYRIGCVTNGTPAMQHHKLDVTRLRRYFDVVLVSGEEGVHKPNGELFRRAAARLGVAAEDCVYVGDHPRNDIEGAETVGMHTVFVDAFGLQKMRHDPTIRTIGELPTVLQEKGWVR